MTVIRVSLGRRLVAATLIVLSALLASGAFAQEPLDIDARYERGRHRFSDGDTQGALDDYRAVFAARPDADVAGNLGNAAYQLGLFAEAAMALRYGVANLPAGDERESKYGARFEQARAQAGALTFAITPVGATVLVDGVVVDEDVEMPLFVMPGPRRIEARLDGHEAGLTTVQAPAGVTTEVALELSPTSPKTVPSQAPSPVPSLSGQDGEPNDDGPAFALGIAGAAVGGAAVIAGAVLLGLSASEASDRVALLATLEGDSHACATADPAAECADVADLDAARRLKGNVGGAFVIGGGVLLTASVILLLWPEAEADDEVASVYPLVGPVMGVGGIF